VNVGAVMRHDQVAIYRPHRAVVSSEFAGETIRVENRLAATAEAAGLDSRVGLGVDPTLAPGPA
jgi:hypothetical protein